MREEAREYFEALGLTYSDINEGDILILSMIINKELKHARSDMSVEMRLSQKINSKYRTNGELISCFLFVNSHYFKQRECISFNSDGFIGFCGWADLRNTKPIINAFKKWCDYLSK
ncbi:hypothetical protein GMB51_11870 [Turicibacter sanguinis]|nr:hypothetical protein [Turicibacter sanguinis]MTN51689.1 hypothetical protein [Turicibacter sanguinis]MTN53509.1 hypothetical protein [Turicibacter sanguinis]MTN57912.1 hypothetical protein [Turicibacter sanguinis]MTN61042.1 hypothetical protein [Turicibacter sanguinis]